MSEPLPPPAAGQAPPAAWLTLLGQGWVAVVALIGLIAGIVAAISGAGPLAALVWTAATIPVLIVLLVEIAVSLRRGMVGLDLVAALSMGAGLLFGEALAAIVVALMYAGGQLLERYAEGRARGEMTALLGRVPREAMRLAGEHLERVPIDALVPGDTILVRSGEALPVDGTVVGAAGALLDESAITGESLPERREDGQTAASGTTNVGDSFHLLVLRPAAQSTYAQIVRLVSTAEQSKAPVQRAADRLAVWFLVLTLAIAGLAWGISGDKLRALAVLVVATPCPLILALPVALISGMSRAAGLGILIKSGGALEALSSIRTVILDKTGTLTQGIAEVTDIRVVGTQAADELLQMAASLDQASHHVIAEALVHEARRRGLALTTPVGVREEAGAGLTGLVGGREVALGSSRFVGLHASGDPQVLHDGLDAGSAVVAVALDGAFAGIIVLRDPLRPEAPEILAGLRAAGVGRIVMASGDRQDVVDVVAAQLHLDGAIGNLEPGDKLMLVRRESEQAPTMMVGDGVNDAPALAAATVGMALGARGAVASSETAGIVILVNEFERVRAAVAIAARTRHIAIQSVLGGLVLSLIGMLAAALGFLPPVAGAMTQEVIDVAVILNALRALR